MHCDDSWSIWIQLIIGPSSCLSCLIRVMIVSILFDIQCFCPIEEQPMGANKSGSSVVVEHPSIVENWMEIVWVDDVDCTICRTTTLVPKVETALQQYSFVHCSSVWFNKKLTETESKQCMTWCTRELLRIGRDFFSSVWFSFIHNFFAARSPHIADIVILIVISWLLYFRCCCCCLLFYSWYNSFICHFAHGTIGDDVNFNSDRVLCHFETSAYCARFGIICLMFCEDNKIAIHVTRLSWLPCRIHFKWK